MLMMIDAFLPEGVTELAVDSIFMTPQLGVLSTVHAEAATQVFERDCLILLGACIAPVGTGRAGQACVQVQVGDAAPVRVAFGELRLLSLPADGRVALTITPERGFDVGAGKGKPLAREVRGGVVGLVVDTRGRQPFVLPDDATLRIGKLREWNRALGLYAKEV
jgi:hypothetical protein